MKARSDKARPEPPKGKTARPEPSTHQLVALAEIARPHGVRGELKLKVYNRDSDLLLAAPEVVIEHEGERSIVEITSARRTADAILVKLVGCDDRDHAESLRGAQVLLPREVFPPADEGEFYVCDIEGARVEGPEGELGTVETIVAYPTVDALVVVTPRGKVEIPLVGDIIESVDIENRVVRLTSLSHVELP